jgi:hypothetical protein
VVAGGEVGLSCKARGGGALPGNVRGQQEGKGWNKNVGCALSCKNPSPLSSADDGDGNEGAIKQSGWPPSLQSKRTNGDGGCYGGGGQS